MPALRSSLPQALKAFLQLGPAQAGFYALYRLGLRTGYYRWATSGWRASHNSRPALTHASYRVQAGLFCMPERDRLAAVLGEQGQTRLLAEADEIAAGQVRLFGGKPTPLKLAPAGPLLHWTLYEQGTGEKAASAEAQDVKFAWEAARFSWAYTLGRAYQLSGDERYPAAFWEYVEIFLEANPPYLGPHWTSAQEVALRLMALVFAAQVFAESRHSTPERAARLAEAVAVHATRIPPTLVYALAQNNNHLLSEAAGLYTAGVALADHPSAKRWRRLGWLAFSLGLRFQIAGDGTYIQHSTNYHRLMLQLALWMNCLGQAGGKAFSEKTQARLAAATAWLLALLDPQSGRVPNLGSNDGAYIMPLTACRFHDYRPVLQAAALAFLRKRAVESGMWDEMALWTGDKGQGIRDGTDEGFVPYPLSPLPSPLILHSPDHTSWAYLRAAHFTGRPGHADQLHLDLWRQGVNVAQDAGTYLYNAPLPWENALMGADVHNTLTVEGQDQMTRAGRFLYLDWAQAQVVEQDSSHVVARHDGYRHLGIIHQRSVTAAVDGSWSVEDRLLPAHRPAAAQAQATLHWLLPDWLWEVSLEPVFVLRLTSPVGLVTLRVERDRNTARPMQVQIVRAGELIYGSGEVKPAWGWSSPTYGDKIPALALRLSTQDVLPWAFTSQFSFG